MSRKFKFLHLKTLNRYNFFVFLLQTSHKAKDICMDPYQKRGAENQELTRWRRQSIRIRTDLEWGVVLGDFHGELVGDGGSAVLQGDQAEVTQAGSVWWVPGCSQNHQAGSGTTQQSPAQSGLRYGLCTLGYNMNVLFLHFLYYTSRKYSFNSSVHEFLTQTTSSCKDPPFSGTLNTIINVAFKSQASIFLFSGRIYLPKVSKLLTDLDLRC